MFIVFGAVTMLGGIIAFFGVSFLSARILRPDSVVVVQDFPDKNTFLTKEQTEWVLDRIEVDRADAQYDPFTAKKLWDYTCDIHNWSFALLFGCATTTDYAFAYFLPIILMEGMGYSSRDAQLLTAPPYVFAAVFSFALAALGDRKRIRGPLIIFQACFSVIGLCMVCLLVRHSRTMSPLINFPTDCLPYKQRCSIRRCLFWYRWWCVPYHIANFYGSLIAP
jgi:Major Facilitator Superfamily